MYVSVSMHRSAPISARLAAGVEPGHGAHRLADEVVFALDVVVVGEHEDRLTGHVVRPREGDDLLALVVDRVGRHDDVDLAVLDERLTVGRDRLGPFDVLFVDAELARDDLRDLDVEADGHAVGADEAEERLVELRADGDRARLGELGHRRAGLEGGGRLCGRLFRRFTAAAGATGERECRRRRCCDECDSHAFHVSASSLCGVIPRRSWQRRSSARGSSRGSPSRGRTAGCRRTRRESPPRRSCRRP